MYLLLNIYLHSYFTDLIVLTTYYVLGGAQALTFSYVTVHVLPMR